MNNNNNNKGRKYDLANDLRLMYPGTKTKIIPIVLTWDGFVTHQFHRHTRALEIKKKIQANIQSTVLKKSVLFDFRNKFSEGGKEDLLDRWAGESP